MRRILYSFLILAFLASVTICGCGHEARSDSHAASHRHDHDHDGGGHNFKHAGKTADMELPQEASLSKLELKTDFSHVVIADIVASFIVPAKSREIRGPPPDWPDTNHTQPAILSVTQRLLI